MRYFFRRRIPLPDSLVLVESGSRHLLERVISGLRSNWGDQVPISLVTCYPTLPEGFPESTHLYRVSDYRGRPGRRRLYRELERRGDSILAIICSGEPLMAKWKWALALRLPAKVLIVNENGDYFWLDRGHLALLWQLVLLRTDLAGAGAVRTLARIVSSPFALAYLLLYATVVHARRALRGG